MSNEQQTLIPLEERAVSVEELWQAAQDASVELEQVELQQLENERWIRDQRSRIEKMQSNMMRRVTAMKVDPEDANSKPLFTNAQQREAEVSDRLNDDPQYRELLAALYTAEGAQAIRKIHVDKLGRDYSLARLRYEALTIGKRYEH